MKKRRTVLGLLTAAVLATATGCGAATETTGNADTTAASAQSDSTAESSDVKKVTIGVRMDLKPTSYLDENGELHGYDIEIIKKVDEMLEDYEFTYEAVQQEPLLIGLDSGKYAAAVAGFFKNPERESKYIFPKENIGGSLIGLVVRKGMDDVITLEDVYDKGLKMTPYSGISGTYTIVDNYNKAHPDKQVELTSTDWVLDGQGYQWIAEGRYDVIVAIKSTYNNAIEGLGLQDKIQMNDSFTAISTWSMFGKDQQELADKYDECLKRLKEDGTISALSVEYFGEDVLPLVDKN